MMIMYDDAGDGGGHAANRVRINVGTADLFGRRLILISARARNAGTVAQADHRPRTARSGAELRVIGLTANVGFSFIVIHPAVARARAPTATANGFGVLGG